MFPRTNPRLEQALTPMGMGVGRLYGVRMSSRHLRLTPVAPAEATLDLAHVNRAATFRAHCLYGFSGEGLAIEH